MFSNSRAVNVLAAARFFLFASRDVWFVVGLPVYLESQLGWSFWQAGAFLALWVIGYGAVQAVAPLLARAAAPARRASRRQDRRQARLRARGVPGGIAIAITRSGVDPTLVIVVGLVAFGVVFAMNSAVHSYLILATPTATRSR